jgi:quercetin dioxygenase-like cupin family protein
MKMKLRYVLIGIALLGSEASATSPSAQPPKDVMEIVEEGEIEWAASRFGAHLPIAILAGDPTKPGPYVVRVKFSPGHMSKPHFHQETRYILVLKGTWWAGWGPSGDHGATVAVPAGSFVVHHPNKIHYDGAKDDEVELLIMGTGPSSITDVDPSGKPTKE